MSQIHDVTQYLSSFVNALYASGVTEAVICPGSRSTPLALALQRQGKITPYVLMDERSAAFFALGMAKVSGKPVVLLSTSGTAAANFMPAVVEAYWAHVPLIILTADRPPELRDSGASQTIDQVRLYGSHVKWFQDMPITNGDEALNRFAAITAERAVYYASIQPHGPVHLNFPFREPLLIEDTMRSSTMMPTPRVVPSIASPHPVLIRNVVHSLRSYRQGLILVGAGLMRPALTQILRLSEKLQWPIFADPLSNIRGLDPHIIGTYDAFLRNRTDLPIIDCIIRFGAPMTSKALNLYTENSYAIIVDGENSYREPQLQPGQVIEGDLNEVLVAINQQLELESFSSDSRWYTFWMQKHHEMLARIENTMPTLREPAEPFLYYHLNQWLTPVAPVDVFVSNSMPVRDLDTFTQNPDKSIQFWANRGANGIDGIISTTMGIAAMKSQAVLITGDLAFYHDMNGLFAAKKYNLDVLIIVINNDGGGIFSFLPQSRLDHEEFETLFGTPHGLTFEHAALLYGAHYRLAKNHDQLQRAFSDLVSLKGLRILEWQTRGRPENVVMHYEFWQG